MLRALSQAAVEARSTGSFTNATRSSGLEVDVESSEDEAENISCWHRLALCIGAWIPTWGHFTFSTVGHSPAAGALALFHCYLFLAGGTLIFINCCTTLLFFYSDWFAAGSIHYEDFRECCSFTLSVEFMGVFLRSCIVLSVSADLLRFAYLLMIDAWRPDVFEAYRRLVVSDAWGELDAGEFYVRGWSMSLSKWQKTGDIVFQLVLHLTLNLIPITGLIIGSLGLVDPITVRKLCLAIGSLHILAFYFLSFHGEVALKLRGFRKAWVLARNLSTSEVSAQITWTRTKSRVVSDAAEQRSICVLCCTIFQWLQSLMPIFSGIAAAILGFIFHRPGLIVVGCVWSALLLFITILTWHSWGSDEENACAPESVHRYFPCPEMLQEWAEKWCNLGFQAQVLHRYHSTVMLGISAAIFGAFGFHSLTITCLTLLTFAMTRILWLQAEGSLGWFYAFVELLITTIGMAMVLVSSCSGNPFKDLLIFMCLSVLRHFGFQRGTSAGERVRVSGAIIFGFVHMFFVLLTCFALRTFWKDESWSAFSFETEEPQFLTIPQHPEVNRSAEWPLCLLRFRFGPGPLQDLRPAELLSVADFALMASLSYEAPLRAEEACSHYFPRWRVEQRPEKQRVMDWSRFLMLTSEDNSTTVITVRGTLDFLDVLQDVALWLVPALMEGLNKLGPDISTGNWGKSISEYAELFPSTRVAADHTFKSVLEATHLMIQSHPSRRFFLTGHSLGGGIAKMVALQIPIASRPLAIAFASPGVQDAARVLFGHENHDGPIQTRLEDLQQSLLDVVPRHDLISLIDQDPGNTLIAPCEGHPWQCHSIFRILWGIFSACGSMTFKNLTLPCEAFRAAIPDAC